ncbi:MAG: TfoX/Sxy family protein [Chthoniobacterales bacterium]
MAYEEELAERVRRALAHLPEVEEKRMFGGLAFLVHAKMCVNVSGDGGLMCRIDPAQHEEAVARSGVSTVTMRGREYLGWVRVEAAALRSAKELNHWVKLTLDFNGRAKSSKESAGQ